MIKSKLIASVLEFLVETPGTTGEIAEALSVDSDSISKAVFKVRGGGSITTDPITREHRITAKGLASIREHLNATVIPPIVSATVSPATPAAVESPAPDCCAELGDAVAEIRALEDVAPPPPKRPAKAVRPVVCAMAIESDEEGLIEVSRVLDRVDLHFGIGFDSHRSLTRPEAKALASMLLEMSK